MQSIQSAMNAKAAGCVFKIMRPEALRCPSPYCDNCKIHDSLQCHGPGKWGDLKYIKEYAAASDIMLDR